MDMYLATHQYIFSTIPESNEEEGALFYFAISSG